MPAPVPPLDGAPPPGRIVTAVALRFFCRSHERLADAASAASPALHAASVTPLSPRSHRETTSARRQPSISTVARLERAQYELAPSVVRRLLATYGADAEQTWEITHLAGDDDGDRKSKEICDLGPGWYQRLAWCEHAATAIRTYDATHLPVALRTPEYNDSLLWVGPQEAHRGARALPLTSAGRITGLIDHTVLERPLGGPAVMARQLDHLLVFVDRGARVRIVPPGGPALWRWDKTSEMTIYGQRLFAVEAARVTYYTGPTAGGPLAEVLDEAEATALSDDESRRLIAAAASRFRKETELGEA
ncbi:MULTISPECIES: Scr1 family TA system antitoxin-like transcriptional regulator [Streptomyces]|uniref:Scr1 family TA system antitoxin-like transcriptional regulator n=1 Tax=Streptomyces ramulosus TaxID=47762 RepID=A0ABW1FCV1_9ACTN